MVKNVEKAAKADRVTSLTPAVLEHIVHAHAAETAHIPDHQQAGAAERTAVLFLIVGPGKRGKTTVARHMAEMSKENGAPLHVFDLERVNPGLRASHGECQAPEYSILTGPELAEWLFPKIEEKASTGQSMLIDLEGNDRRILELCGECDLIEVLEHLGVALVVVAVTGGADDDVGLLSKLVSALGGARDYDLLLVVAERLLPGHRKTQTRIEQAIFADEAIETLMQRPGSDIVFMPTCDTISKLDQVPTTFRQASRERGGVTKTNPLALWERSMVGNYLRKVDRCFAPVLACRR